MTQGDLFTPPPRSISRHLLAPGDRVRLHYGKHWRRYVGRHLQTGRVVLQRPDDRPGPRNFLIRIDDDGALVVVPFRHVFALLEPAVQPATAPERVRLCIGGSRAYPHLDFVRYYVWTLRPFVHSVILGMCPRGVDAAALSACERHGVAVEACPADWDTYGRAAGPLRNAHMVEIATAVVAFWDGHSRGTRNLIGRAREAGKLRAVYGPTMELMT